MIWAKSSPGHLYSKCKLHHCTDLPKACKSLEGYNSVLCLLHLRCTKLPDCIRWEARCVLPSAPWESSQNVNVEANGSLKVGQAAVWINCRAQGLSTWRDTAHRWLDCLPMQMTIALSSRSLLLSRVNESHLSNLQQSPKDNICWSRIKVRNLTMALLGEDQLLWLDLSAERTVSAGTLFRWNQTESISGQTHQFLDLHNKNYKTICISEFVGST